MIELIHISSTRTRTFTLRSPHVPLFLCGVSGSSSPTTSRGGTDGDERRSQHTHGTGRKGRNRQADISRISCNATGDIDKRKTRSAAPAVRALPCQYNGSDAKAPPFNSVTAVPSSTYCKVGILVCFPCTGCEYVRPPPACLYTPYICT